MTLRDSKDSTYPYSLCKTVFGKLLTLNLSGEEIKHNLPHSLNMDKIYDVLDYKIKITKRNVSLVVTSKISRVFGLKQSNRGYRIEYFYLKLKERE
jgi:hypothetical protein